METVELIKIPVQVLQVFDDMPFVRDNLQLEQIRDRMLMQMAVKLRSYVLAEEQEGNTREVTVTYEVPVIPEILAKMFDTLRELPTEKRTETIKVNIKKRLIYPDANIRIPNLGSSRVRFMVEEEIDGQELP